MSKLTESIQTAMFGCPIATVRADVSRARARDLSRGDGAAALVLSLLSDAQELTGLNRDEDADHLINRAKYIVDTYLAGR